MGVRDFLERLRPSGTPGAPSVAGVPADRLAEHATELEAVFALLEDVQAQAARIRSAADEEARRRRDEAQAQADGIVAAARRLAEAERATAAASARAGAAEQVRAIAQDAQTRASSIAGEGHTRSAALVAAVVEQARAELLGVPAGSP
jgi:vacuolar-type H+-ATPase subunit E/Vma4